MPTECMSDAAPTDERELRRIALLAAMELVATTSWHNTSFHALSNQTGLTLVQLHRLFPTRMHLLVEIDRQADDTVLNQPAPDPADSAHDRLFDILMRRFDALEPFRPGLRVLSRGGIAALAAPALAPGLIRSMGWMLEATGLSVGGLSGALRKRGLAAVWLATVRTWLNDDSVDKSATMATLDRNLKRAYELWNSIPLSFRACIEPK